MRSKIAVYGRLDRIEKDKIRKKQLDKEVFFTKVNYPEKTEEKLYKLNEKYPIGYEYHVDDNECDCEKYYLGDHRCSCGNRRIAAYLDSYEGEEYIATEAY